MRLAFAIASLYLLAAPAGWAEPLQGSIEQTSVPGGTQQTVLPGNAAGWGAPLNQQTGSLDQRQQGPMQGTVSGNNPLQANAFADPDGGNQELNIAWDQWRNRLMQAIQGNTLAKINVHDDVQFVWDPRTQMMQSRYPNGTSAWYSCSVLPNLRIVNVRITLSSRYPTYDQAVLQAINDLQGNLILRYPQGSRRQIVTQEASVGTAPQSSSQTYKFGDIERQSH
jgi:hypothetical protein